MPAPSTYFKVLGDHKLINSVKLKRAGAWVDISKIYTKVSGAWKLVFFNPAFSTGLEFTHLFTDTAARIGPAGTSGQFIYNTTSSTITRSTLSPFSTVDTDTGLDVYSGFLADEYMARTSAGYTVTYRQNGININRVVIDPSGTPDYSTTSNSETIRLMSDGAVYSYSKSASPGFTEQIVRVSNSTSADLVRTLGASTFRDMTEDNSGNLILVYSNGDVGSIPLGSTSHTLITTVSTNTNKLVYAGDGSIWTIEFSGTVKRNDVTVTTLKYDIARDWVTGKILVTGAANSVLHYAADGSSFTAYSVSGLSSATPYLLTSKYQPNDMLLISALGHVYRIAHA